MSNPLSPPYHSTFSIANIPKNNTIKINDIFYEKPINEYYDKIKAIITEYRNDTQKHELISSILAVPYYALMTEGFLNNKSEINYKIKFNGKIKDYKFEFDNIAIDKEKKLSKEDDFAQLIGYDLTDLPLLAKLLAIGNHLTDDSVKQRLAWMKLSEANFKYSEKSIIQLEYTGQIQCLIEDLTINWRDEYINGWQKLVRYFLLGLMMYGYYENDLSKVIKKSKKKNIVNPTFINKLNKAVSKCISSIMKEDQTSRIINKALDDLNLEKESPDNHVTKENLTKNLRKHMKFSYYLFYFVRMFGYVSLISSSLPSPSDSLLKLLNPRNLSEINDCFEELRRNQLGQDLISKNNDYAVKICGTIIECAENMKINNKKLETGLKNLISNYTFNNTNIDITMSSSDEENDENDQLISFEKGLEIPNNEIDQNDKDNLLNNINNIKSAIADEQPGGLRRNRRDITKRNDQQRINKRRLRGSNMKKINPIRFDDFTIESQISDSRRSDMINKIKFVQNALNEDSYNELYEIANENVQKYNQLDQKDAQLASAYNTFKNFVNSNQVKILSESEKNNIINVRDDFQRNLTDENRVTFKEIFDNNVKKAQSNVGFKCLKMEDKELLIIQESINDFYNSPKLALDNSIEEQ